MCMSGPVGTSYVQPRVLAVGTMCTCEAGVGCSLPAKGERREMTESAALTVIFKSQAV